MLWVSTGLINGFFIEPVITLGVCGAVLVSQLSAQSYISGAVKLSAVVASLPGP